VKGVRQSDGGIDDTFVSSMREDVSFAPIDFQDWLNSRYESMGDTIVQLRGAFGSG
jgi:hypothetical protein